MLDATVGLAGHARHFLEAVGQSGRLIGLDVDPGSLEIARDRLGPLSEQAELIHANFERFDEELASLSIDGVDVMLADLGVSSAQLADSARGLSFNEDGPLDMRLDPNLEVTAADLVNRLSERELSDLIFYNSQERLSRRIARRICQVRREGRITTAKALATVVAGAVGVNPASRKSKIHPATRTFLAFRIAVNRELESLDSFLAKAPHYLKLGGRIGIISFHSLEDGRVKQSFRRGKADDVYEILTKKPVTADQEERSANPRSRSAKLRVAKRIEGGIIG